MCRQRSQDREKGGAQKRLAAGEVQPPGPHFDKLSHGAAPFGQRQPGRLGVNLSVIAVFAAQGAPDSKRDRTASANGPP